MKMKLYRILACVLTVCALLTMAACGKPDEPTVPSTAAPTEAEEVLYEVSITDALGQIYTHGIIVKFMKDGVQAAMQPVGDNGVAAKKLPAGEYTIELLSTDQESAFYYDVSAAVVTAEKTSISIEIASVPSGHAQTIYADGEEFQAPVVSAGCHHIALKEGMNYVLFMAPEAGEYVFSLPGSTAKIGYYGMPHFVQSQSALEVVNNTVTMTIRASMISKDDPGSSVFVIGIESDGSVDSCTLAIDRIGDPAWDVSEEPWITYQATAALTPYVLPEGAQLTDFDVTASTDAYQLVYNETDGFYHLDTVDGPLVLMYLTAPSQYLDDLVTVAGVSSICRYFYDADGKFLKRETYNECILKYGEYTDKTAGVYPLTQDLMYIIQNHGTYYGWWNMDNRNTCLFKDENGNIKPGINPEIAWLFACCYIAS